MARPTKLTPDVQKRIVQGIQLGATYELAAQAAGISYNSFNNWMNRGKAEIERRQSPRVKEGTEQWQAEQPFVEFLEEVKRAEGLAVIGWLATIQRAAVSGNWQAAAWKLERRYPEDYGRQVRDVTHSGKDGGDIIIRFAWAEPDNADN